MDESGFFGRIVNVRDDDLELHSTGGPFCVPRFYIRVKFPHHGTVGFESEFAGLIAELEVFPVERDLEQTCEIGGVRKNVAVDRIIIHCFRCDLQPLVLVHVLMVYLHHCGRIICIDDVEVCRDGVLAAVAVFHCDLYLVTPHMTVKRSYSESAVVRVEEKIRILCDIGNNFIYINGI